MRTTWGTEKINSIAARRSRHGFTAEARIQYRKKARTHVEIIADEATGVVAHVTEHLTGLSSEVEYCWFVLWKDYELGTLIVIL